MSIKLSFRERLERPVDTKAESRPASFSPVEIQIDLRDGFESSIALALLLRDNGLDLQDAHAAVTALAAERTVTLTLRSRELREALKRITDMMLDAHVVRNAGSFRILMPGELLPDDPVSATRNARKIASEIYRMKVGDLRLLHGDGFAKNFKSSALMSDVFYYLDEDSLEVIAANATLISSRSDVTKRTPSQDIDQSADID